jgi:hypothetical protein
MSIKFKTKYQLEKSVDVKTKTLVIPIYYWGFLVIKKTEKAIIPLIQFHQSDLIWMYEAISL